MAQVQVIQPYQPQSEELEKVAAYCRVSTDSKDQLNSYRTQIGYYTTTIAQHPGWELADIYADEGISGTSLEKRDEFKRMLQDCRTGKIQRILVKSVSRFARNTLELIETTRELKELGVVVVFEEQGIDTSQMLGEMQLTLLAMAAQEESTSISKNMRWSIQKRMEDGTFITCYPAYGFDLKNGTLYPKEEEAAVVRIIVSLASQGMGHQRIADYLNEQEIPPRNGRKKWLGSTVGYILSNEKLIGDSLVQKEFTPPVLPFRKIRNHGQLPKYYVADSHEGIIDHALYDNIQKLAEQRRASYQNHVDHLFTHRILCPDCGRHFRHTESNKLGYWVCSNRVNGLSDCRAIRISEKALVQTTLSMMGKLYENLEKLLLPTLSLLEEIAARQEKGNQKLCEINIALADLNEKAHSLQRLHNKGFIEDEEFREQNNALAAQRKKLSNQRAKAVHGSKALETLGRLEELQEQLDALPEIPWKFDIDLFDQLIEKIVPISNTELLFQLKCGLELKEVLTK